jgi:hypothetical protein
VRLDAPRLRLLPSPCNEHVTPGADSREFLGLDTVELVDAAVFERSPMWWTDDEVQALETINCTLRSVRPTCHPVMLHDEDLVVLTPEGRPEVVVSGIHAGASNLSLLPVEPPLVTYREHDVPGAALVVMARHDDGWKRMLRVPRVAPVDTCRRTPPCTNPCVQRDTQPRGHRLVRDEAARTTRLVSLEVTTAGKFDSHPVLDPMACEGPGFPDMPARTCDRAMRCETEAISSTARAVVRIWSLDARPVELPALVVDPADADADVVDAVPGGRNVNVILSNQHVLYVPNGT